MEVLIRHGEGLLSEAFTRYHRIVCDQPFEVGGTDHGMTPPELMLAALGSCAMHYAVEYLRARALSLDGVKLRVTAEKGDRPLRLIEIDIGVHAPGLSSNAQAGLIKAVEACLLHRTLVNPPEVKIHMAASVTEESHAKELVGSIS